ncbi:MAG: hypothetical protein K2X81_27700 [Candidatus Obscuribacterales bacterium]|nr:hypothetical protein [Candidatus Obscuribacterales bacterium]
MTTAPGKAQHDDFVYIAAALQPRSREDGSYRLAYLTATLSMLSAECLSDSLHQCRQGKLGEKARSVATEPVPYDKYADAIKHLTCIILYLISFEQGEQSPEWLVDFLASCVHSMDQVVQGIPVQTTMGRYAMLSGEDVYAAAAKNLMQDLNFGDSSELASRTLAEYLRSSAGYRSQVLHFALTQDREFIEKRWREIITQNTLSTE